MNENVGIGSRITNWIYSLPRAALAGGALAATALFVSAAIYAYRTYDYIQHDNDFCLSCHLMVDPFERFARSAHREMGCKSCHQPTIVARSQMALTQIIENPDSLQTHAEVPNERCAECHIDGDPEQWTLVANSAGHRVHFESKEPELQGLQCVQCHASSLHEFTAADQTCGQSNCHTDVRVQLGKMGDFTIHCAACHAFSAPVPDTAGVASAALALRPARNECFSCHAMRTLVEMPADDPHEGVCASCHNPHTQTTPAQAVETCATNGCHTRADTITAFHRGLAPGILERCTACHAAHAFRAPGTDCVDCHKDIDAHADTARMRTGGMRMSSLTPGHPAAASAGARSDVAPRNPWLHLARAAPAGRRAPAPDPADLAPAPQAVRSPPRQQAPQIDSTRFRHTMHRIVACTECHSTDESHGTLTVTTPRDCQRCHHSPRFAQGPRGCARCHAPEEFASKAITRSQTLRFIDGRTDTRSLPFDHRAHESRTCTECHTTPVTLATAGLSCNQCHAEHHEPTNDCTACHTRPRADVHPRASAHLSCDGAGCHRGAPVNASARTRPFCLACHQDQKTHREGQNCIDCHPLPAPRAPAAARKDAPR